MGFRILFVGIFALVATGCSAAAPQPDASTFPDDAGADGGVDGGAGGGTDAGTVASHAPFPQVVDNGGDILASPSLVTVTFPGYQYESQVQAFGDWAVVSDWFLTAGMEYGVGAGQHLQKVVLPDAAPTEFDEASIATFLTNRIGLGQLPPPSAGILYMLYLPPGTIVTRPVNGQPVQVSCRQLLAAHNFLRLGASDFAYAWVATCEQPVPDFPVPFGLDGVTAAASHELIEAATDPFGQGFHLLNYDYSDPWAFLGTEVGDLCLFSFATAGGVQGSARLVESGGAARRLAVPACAERRELPERDDEPGLRSAGARRQVSPFYRGGLVLPAGLLDDIDGRLGRNDSAPVHAEQPADLERDDSIAGPDGLADRGRGFLLRLTPSLPGLAG